MSDAYFEAKELQQSGAWEKDTLVCRPCMGKLPVIGHEIVPRQGKCERCEEEGTVWSVWLPQSPGPDDASRAEPK